MAISTVLAGANILLVAEVSGEQAMEVIEAEGPTHHRTPAFSVTLPE
jgi:hypothetical protein